MVLEWSGNLVSWEPAQWLAGIWSHCGWLGAKDNLELGVSGVSLQPESSGGLPEGLFCWDKQRACVRRNLLAVYAYRGQTGTKWTQ